MSIDISQPIHREGGFAIDDSLLLTKAQMRDMPDNMMPSMYFCICLEDGKLYLYDKSATPDAETGKYSLYSNESVSPFVELDALPEANEETYNLYKGMLVFVPSSEPTADNKFDEYKIHQDTSTTPTTYYWDKVGDIKVEVDLSEYLKYTDVLSFVDILSDKPVSGKAVGTAMNNQANVFTQLLDRKQNKLNEGEGISLNSAINEISVDTAKESDFTDEDIANMADVTEQSEFFRLNTPLNLSEVYVDSSGKFMAYLLDSESPQFDDYEQRRMADPYGFYDIPLKVTISDGTNDIVITNFTKMSSPDAITSIGTHDSEVIIEFVSEALVLNVMRSSVHDWLNATLDLTVIFEY